MKGAPAIRPKFETLNEMLDAAARSGESLFFVGRDETDRQIPMDEIRRHARSVAAGLRGAGVASGDRVALVLPTGPEFVACFFGVLGAGAIPVPLYPPVRLGKLDEYHDRTAAMLRSVQAALVVTDERIRPLLGVAVANAAPPLGCVTASGVSGAGGPEINVAADDVALIQFSSGTTHHPKPVALTHKNLLYNLAAITDYFAGDGTPDPVGVTWLPLYHDMGLIGNLLAAFYRQRPLVLLPPELFLAVPAAWFRAISRHRGTYTAAPNFAFGLCLKRIRDDELAGVDLSSWSLCLNGAEMISAGVQRRFSERFGRWGFEASAFTPVYGLAEASLAVTFKPAHSTFNTIGARAENLASAGVVEPGNKELVSTGRPLAGIEVEIRGDDSRPVPSDRVGRIFVRGPNVMAGYFARADLTDQVLHDGWLDCGDLGFIHGGELFVCGRSKETVIIRGANHAPQDFEAALGGLPGVRTGCAVAVGYIPLDGGDAGDEALAMLVETTTGAPPSLASDVAARVLQRTGIAVEHVELLAPGTLPRTSSGKLRRLEGRAHWLAGTLSPPQKVSSLRLLLAAAKGRFAHARASGSRRATKERPADPAPAVGQQHLRLRDPGRKPC
ncbi:MAG: AMP-binding protein [Mycobacterium sp.]|uniref:AMP-binding protein n=1 Tax=Mycobacterium sp. TaxID=1785 RepID=UPI003F9AD2E9